jgi:DNA-directed RNA polymerase
MIKRGAEAYLRGQRKAEESGRGADLDYSRRLMSDYMSDLIEAFTAMMIQKGAGRYGRAKALLFRIDADKAVFITLRTIFNSFMNDNQQLVDVAIRIGRYIEDDIRFQRFQELHGKYYDTIIQDFKRKGTKDYRYMHRVLTNSANDKEDQWEPWTQAERADVGCRMLDVVLQNSDLLEKVHIKAGKNQQVFLKPSAEAQKWINEHEDAAQLLMPDRCPTIIEPDDWSDIDQGGYYSPQLRQTTPMVKTSGALQRKRLRSADLTLVQESLNTVQHTPWAVNTDVLDVVKTVWAQNLGIGMPGSEKIAPEDFALRDQDKATFTEEQQQMFVEWKREAAELYTKEKERVSRAFQTTRIMRMANDYSTYPRFWYVWYADFRGRLYTATAGFSPQGPDIAKGLLRLANGKALGARGLYWLKVHGANRFGYDKCSYDDRVAWVDARHDEFVQAGLSPMDYRGTWADADKPYQFLAFLIEYAQAHALSDAGLAPTDFVSRLPIGLDGSCNGLQNFSAMLRDPIGGRATNLTPSDKPSDIYSLVAKVCTGKLDALPDWTRFVARYGTGEPAQLPRSLAKRPVMTLPYGATRQSCTKYIFLSILDTDAKHFESNFKAACELTPLLWDSIGEVVVSARVAMDWLQSVASAMTKVNKPIVWTLPDGFVSVQHSKAIETVQVETQLQGRFRLRVGSYTDKIAGAKQRQGVSPNFVHSMDASHLRATVRLAKARGIDDMALIHDDYGTYAADTDTLHECIREAFVGMYTEHDPLADFAAEQEAAGGVLPPMPVKGTLDIRDVLRSPYFFG